MNGACEHFETECGCIRGFGCDIFTPCTKHVAWKPIPCSRAPKLTATDRRFAALCEVSHSGVTYNPETRSNDWHVTMDNRAEFAARIRTLTAYGRTERWIVSVESWAVAVETAENVSTLEWAWFQYATWTGHAAS